MSDCLILKNAKFYDSSLSLRAAKYFVAQNGKIVYIGDECLYTSKHELDCSGQVIAKPFCDHHYHLPGSMLYDLFGVNLCEYNVTDYKSVLSSASPDFKAIRGFGWEICSMKQFFSNYDKTPLQFIDEIFPTRAAIIFSLDFHSCWCNSVALSILNEEGISCDFADSEIPNGAECILHEKIAEQIFKCKRLCFNDEEIELAILKEQDRLISKGICEIYSLMFIGAPYFSVLNALKRLDDKGLIKIKINYAYTTNPSENTASICEGIERSLSYQSERLSLSAIKVYVDGVIDNHSAVLLENYSDKTECGKRIWNDGELDRVTECALSYDLPLHIHAIGDGAVYQAARVLSNHKRPSKRHIITHIQLCSNKAIQLMTENDIVACMQPFWFYRGKMALPLDKARLGDRVERLYPVRSLIDSGVKVIFSSDCPATLDYSPICGMKVASSLESKEQISMRQAYYAYYSGSYFDEDISFKVGDDATLILLDKDMLEHKSALIHSVYINAKRVF